MRCDSTIFDGNPETVARRLLGLTIVRQLNGIRLSGIIVEVEAYLSNNDAASHSAVGKRQRNASMFAPAGTLYVYTIHTRHCLNIVTEPAEYGSAVLIRAIEPIDGILQMCQNRKVSLAMETTRSATWLRNLTSGPGRLCQALQIDLDHDGINLNDSPEIWLEEPTECVRAKMTWQIARSTRIGISKSVEHELRFFVDGHQLVSGCAKQHTQGRFWKFHN